MILKTDQEADQWTIDFDHARFNNLDRSRFADWHVKVDALEWNTLIIKALVVEIREVILLWFKLFSINLIYS